MSNTPTPAFTGTGNFATTQTFNTIKEYAETTIGTFDFSQSVQVTFDVRTFNNLIGIQKDASNISIVTSGYYDNSNNVLLTDSLSISAATFMSGINMVGSSSAASNIVSVGTYTTFYQYFANYIASYFNLPSPSNPEAQGVSQGISTLYSGDYNFLPNNGIFDQTALLNMLNGTGVNDGSGGYIQPLAGTISLSGITASLRNAVDKNPFGNRNATTGTTASNPDRHNYGVSDGFYDGDVIYIAGGGLNQIGDVSGANVNGDGILLTMKLMIDPIFSPGNIANNNTITRSLGTSLVIRLKNLSSCVLSELSYMNSSTTQNFFSLQGTYASFIVGRSTILGTFSNQILTSTPYPIISYPASSYVVGAGTPTSPNNGNFTDTVPTASTTYYYSFTPVDINGYTGVTTYTSATTHV